MATKNKKRKKRRSSSRSRAAAIISAVLDDDDLLGKVLLRLALPTSLLRAALVCRPWLRVASDEGFLLRFNGLHPPRLLGFFVQSSPMRNHHLQHGMRSSSWVRPPKFARMPGLPPELAAAVRRASSVLDAYAPDTSKILDCRNGRLLVRLAGPNGRDALLSPLLHSERGAAILPPRPPSTSELWLTSGLPHGSVTVCAACWKHGEEQHHQWTINTYELRDGAWRRSLSSSAPEIELPWVPRPCSSLPVHDKIYYVSSATAIAELRSALSSDQAAHLRLVALPDGVDHRLHRRNFVTWSDGFAIYLIQVDIKELQLRVWLYRMDSKEWSIEDTICLLTLFYGMSVIIAVDGLGQDIENNVVMHAVGPRRNAMCVLLQVGTDVFYIDIKSRTAKKVYTVKPNDGDSITLVPFTTIFPPIFPVTKDVSSY